MLISDKALAHILEQPENKNLSWNNYLEDIGEGRQYKGQWIKKQDFVDPMTQKRRVDNVDTLNPDTPDQKTKSKTQWRGFGTIVFPDGARYQGQTENG